jgi:cation-transporting P-type ATPase F
MQSTQNKSGVHWHKLAQDEVVQLLDADLLLGLSAEQVRLRHQTFGANTLTPARRISPLKRFVLQLAQPLIYILIIAAAVTFSLGEPLDAAVILGVVVLNAIVGYFQESKAEKAIEALAQMVVTEATVRRDGQRHRVDSADLVPGDVVLLQSGDKVPADLRLFTVKGLQGWTNQPSRASRFLWKNTSAL